MNKLAIILILLVAFNACGKAKSEEELVIGYYQNQIKSLELPECDKALDGNEMAFMEYMVKVDQKYIKENGIDETAFQMLLVKHANNPAVLKAEEESKTAGFNKINKTYKQKTMKKQK